jgi:hypothetical protein
MKNFYLHNQWWLSAVGIIGVTVSGFAILKNRAKKHQAAIEAKHN